MRLLRCLPKNLEVFGEGFLLRIPWRGFFLAEGMFDEEC